MIIYKNYGRPKSNTPGQEGDIYVDLSHGKVYECRGVTNPAKDLGFVITYPTEDRQYIWKTVKFFGDKFHDYYEGDEREYIDELEYLDTSNGSDFSRMFAGCSNLTTIPQLDTSNGEYFVEMFAGCSNLTIIPQLDTSNGIEFGSMFYECSNLTTIPQLDTSNGEYFVDMFIGCSNLTTIPQLDTSNGINFAGMFIGCSNLTTIPQLDTSNGEYFVDMFHDCSNLTTIPQLDTSNGIEFGSMFAGCSSLTDLCLYNIKTSIELSDGESFGTLLSVDSLVHTFKELHTVTTEETLTISSVNLDKLNGLYCRVLDDTDSKKPMELCDASDEGAMTLLDYAQSKGWSVV